MWRRSSISRTAAMATWRLTASTWRSRSTPPGQWGKAIGRWAPISINAPTRNRPRHSARSSLARPAGPWRRSCRSSIDRRAAMSKCNLPTFGRRRVLKAAAVVSAATLVPSLAAKSQNVPKATPMTDELTADEIVTLLKLEPNATCGFVRVTFVSKHSIAAGGLPAPFADGRPLGSALYFMVTPGAPVRLHRIRNEQLYHYYLGALLV